jgi:hypothetical protein
VAAHVGGLAGGFLCGLAFSMPLPTESLKRRGVRYSLFSAVGGVILIAAAARLPHAIDLGAHVKQLGSLEAKTNAKYAAAMQSFRAGKIPSAEFGGLVETQVLGEWIAEHDALAKVRGLPFRQSRVITMLVRYMELRRDGWLALTNALRDGKMDNLREGMEKQRQASQELKELTRFIKTP